MLSEGVLNAAGGECESEGAKIWQELFGAKVYVLTLRKLESTLS